MFPRLASITSWIPADPRHAPGLAATRSTLPLLSRWLIPIASIVMTGTGCLVPTPIALFPAPEAGSGMKLKFYDGLGRPISEDGLLIIHREYEIPVGWIGETHDCGVSNKVVTITNGQATLPCQWTVASLWLLPNMFSYFIIPVPYVLPEDNLEIIPLLPGYNYHSAAEEVNVFGKGGEIFPSQIPRHRFKDGRVYLSRSAHRQERAIMYFEAYILPYLRRQNEKRSTDTGPDLRLRDEDFTRVTSFIAEELERLRAIPPAQSEPASSWPTILPLEPTP